ncbi:zinc transport system substrate-binding protein [Marmoricola sp. OAE513]|uniref:metal ABC transporter substrate-binding protein n=1 Tax=Marmoricola sp. OAE513 TaxID=2817894 RepID=UPI001AEADF0D
MFRIPRSRSLKVALAGLILLPLSACGGSDDGRTTVVASFYPLQFVAERIVGDHAKVENLTAPGVEPHDLELKTRQVAELAGSDLVLFEAGLQPAVDKAIENSGPDERLDVASVIELHHEDEHADEHGEDHEEGAGHDHDGDPHFWQDPTLLAQVADSFTAKMAKIDPDHAADYRANNDALQKDLAALDQEISAGLQACTSRTLVVSHDAFNYFAERYDLEVHAIAGLSPDAEPSPKHLAELADLIRTDKITTVFNETLASPKLAKTLADDLGITTAVLDPIEGLSDATAGKDYLSLMRSNLAAIQKADSCS